MAEDEEPTALSSATHSKLDALGGCDCITSMRKRIWFALSLALLVGALTACVGTVDGGKTTAVPWVRDYFEGRYPRSLDQCFQAAKEVIAFKGQLLADSTLHGQTNAVKTVHGKINQRDVWVRVEAVEPKVTSVMVQARTKGGGADLPLTHEVEKEIGMRLR